MYKDQEHVRKFLLQVSAEDEFETDHAMRSLRQELLEVDVDSADFSSSSSPPLAKGDAISIGELVVVLSNSAIITAMIDLIRTWVARRKRTKVIITYKGRSLEISDLDARESQKVIDAFVAELDQ